MNFDIDEHILNVCTKFSHKLQRTTGITSYSIAKVGAGCCALSVMTDAINHYYPFSEIKSTTVSVVVDSVLLVDMVYRSIKLTKADESIGDVKPSFLLPYSERSSWRLLWFGWMMFDIGFFCWRFSTIHYVLLEFFMRIGFSLGLVIFYYFVAVDPLPPGKSKIRQWIESFGKVLRPATQEN